MKSWPLRGMARAKLTVIRTVERKLSVVEAVQDASEDCLSQNVDRNFICYA